MLNRATAALLSAGLLTWFACGQGEVAVPVGTNSGAAKTNSTAAGAGTTRISNEVVDTLDNLMLFSDGLLAYQAENWQQLPETSSYEELRTILAPGYIAQVPATDGWGTPFKLVADRERGTRYRFASPGGDKVYQMADKEILSVSDPSRGEVSNVNTDFISASDDVFIYPKIGSLATQEAPDARLVVARVTNVRFGVKGQFVAAQGVVGNASQSAIGSIEPVVAATCTEAPTKIVSDKSKRLLTPDITVSNLQPGMLQPFRAVAELDLSALSQPCTLALEVSFHETGGRAIAHKVSGDTRQLLTPPGGLTASDAKEGEIVTHVNTVSRQILGDLSERSGVSYEIKASDPVALDITPVPFEATKKGLRVHFQTYMSKHDWTEADVAAAVDSATARLSTYLRDLTPGPESAAWSQFRRRNFEALKQLAQKKLEKENNAD